MPSKLSLIVATKDRPADLRRLLESLQGQTVKASEIVIVDGGSATVDSMVREFPELPIRYLRHWPPSAAAQRNAGIRAGDSSATLIGFADDDTTFEPGAMGAMLHFWEAADAGVLGAAFNMLNCRMPPGQLLKHSRLSHALGLYSAKAGGVARSGWQSVTGRVETTRFVEWLPSGAVVWRRSALESTAFDEYFDTYSYLEDLDLSYSIGQHGRLAIVAEAGYRHFPSHGGRVSNRRFGRLEVRNRLYFVRKHGLSVPLCLLALAVRFLMTLSSSVFGLDAGLFARAAGNLEGLIALLPAHPREPVSA
ncbi:MAG: glycosyltransferase [Terracidiphilus sp.]